MTYPILHPELRPSSEGYSAAFPTTFVTSATRGGAPRRRKDFSGGLHQVNVTWTLDKLKYDYLMSFYRLALNKGVLPFVMDLIVESSDMQPYTCWIVADSFGLTSQTGLRYNVGASLLVLELDEDALKVYDEKLIMLFNEYGEDAPDILAMLHDLVNNRLPTLEVTEWPTI